MEDAVGALQQTIAALEAQRALIGAAAVDAALRPLRERLSQLQRPGEQQLRQVSVLFVDIAGSTALARQLHPEQVHEVMDGALRRFTQRVLDHGGRVLQYAGDSLLAAFGTPVAREDDAARAVRAGLAVLADAREQADAVRTQVRGGDGFSVRAGIATGSVLLGGGVEGDASIRGAVVNLAARMEQTAPPGALRICPDTRRLVRGLFELDAQPPLLVKGYVEPVATWLVQGAVANPALQATRGVGGVHTPLVGRAGELSMLQAAYRERGGGTPAVVVVLGDAGLGKTRLAAEFRDWTRQQPGGSYWLEAHASERGAGQPYGLLRQLLTRHLGLLESDSATDARDAWLRAATPLLARAGDAAVLGHLLGLDFAAHEEVRPLLAVAEGRQLRDRGFFHAVQALSRIAAGAGTLALFLDDLQWADPGTLEFIDFAQREGAGLAMLLCSARPALDEQRPGWARKPGRVRIELVPLASGDAGTLADALLARLQGAQDAPVPLRQRLIDGAEGNPFYMEELVNMLIDRGVIVEHDGAWRLGERALADTAMPSTLAGVLQARLDELEPAQARAVQLAAVVGPVFWADALRALGLADADALQPLVQRQFIVPRRMSTLAGQQEYAFRHHLLHQVCYERVLRRVKTPAHAKVAQWLAAQPGEWPLDLLAEHHERGEQREQAVDAWQKAAETARARYANEQAIAHAQRALQLLPADELERRFDLVFLRVDAMNVRADDAVLEQELAALEALAARMDDGRRARTALRRAVHLEHRGHIEESLRLAESVWHQVATAWPGVAAHAGRGIAGALTRLGRTAAARPWAQAALGLARETGDTVVEGALLNELAGIASQDGDPDQAVALYEEALACHRAVGHRIHEAGVLSNLGYVDLRLGNYDQAAARFAEARTLASGVGQRALEGIVLINLALALRHGGRPADAVAQADAARALLQTAGNRWAEAAALRVMGQCELDLGQAARAGERLADAHARFASMKLTAMAAEAAALLAEARLAEGRRDEAAALVDEVLAAIDDGVSLEGCEEPVRVHLSCWRVLHALADPRALPRLSAAQAQLRDRASRVKDPAQRERFLQRVPDHRALLQAP